VRRSVVGVIPARDSITLHRAPQSVQDCGLHFDANISKPGRVVHDLPFDGNGG